jgi:hypothetical protein
MPFAVWKTSANDDWPDTSPSDDSFRNPRRISSPDSHGPKNVAAFKGRRLQSLAKAIALGRTRGAFHLVDLFVSRRHFLDVADLGRPRGNPTPDLEVERPTNIGHPSAGLACSDTFVTSGGSVLTGSERRWLSRALSEELPKGPPTR